MEPSTHVGEPVDPTPDNPEKTPGRGGRRFWVIVLAVLVGIGVYAYAFEKTGVNFDEIQNETRQESLVRILRELAHPELLTYDSVKTALDAEFMSPCPNGGFTPEDPDDSGAHVTITPSCVEPGGDLTLNGFNLDANRGGDIFYVTADGIEIRLGDFQTDVDGTFTETIATRERESDVPQTIRAVTAVRVGSLFNRESVATGDIDSETGEEIYVTSPRISRTSVDTWDKIVETVFLALIATTVGTLIAIPLSFFAARNLMKDIAIPLMALTK